MTVADLKKLSSLIELDGIQLNYFKEGYSSITKEGIEVALPGYVSNLDITVLLDDLTNQLETGTSHIAAWENPEIKYNRKMYVSEKIAIGYWSILAYLGLKDTRDLWKQFDRHHSTYLSYLKNGVFASMLVGQYKVAFLTCYLQKYDIEHITEIKEVFAQNQLHRDNYIFYILFLMEERYGSLFFDTDDVCILTVADLDQENEEFISSIMPLFMYHVTQSLAFIVSSHRLSNLDMVNELSAATSIAYLRARPFHSKAYAQSYAKRALTNMVPRIIYAYTHYDSKKRMVTDGDGYTNTHLGLTALTAQSGFNVTASSTVDSDQLNNSLFFGEDRMHDYLDEINENNRRKIG